MWIIVSSVLLGLIGVVASRIGLTYLTADGTSRDPHAYWARGLVTLLPAWLVAFLRIQGINGANHLTSRGNVADIPIFERLAKELKQQQVATDDSGALV